MLHPYGLDRLALEGILDHGRVRADDLPGLPALEVARLVVALRADGLVETDWKGRLWVTEAGKARLQQAA